MYLILFIPFFLLQIYICKNYNKKLCLILPIISLIINIISILCFIIFILFVILQHLKFSNKDMITNFLLNWDLGNLIFLFLLYIGILVTFIPTIIFCFINIKYKKPTYK